MNQIIAITLMNLRSLPARLAPSLVVVAGIAGVVLVLIGLLALAQGFESTLRSASHADRALVLRGGATTEMSSGLGPAEAALIRTKPGLAQGPEGPLAAAEIYVIADIPKRGAETTSNLPMRGVEARSFAIRDEVRLVAGRKLEFGKYEMIAGVKAAHQFAGLDIGSALSIRGADWRVVGHFESGGSVFESEVWVDVQALSTNLKRGGAFTSMVAQLESPQEFDLLDAALEADPQLQTSLISETDYYAEQARLLTGLIENFGYFVAGIMAVGAIFAALNTMYSAVSARAVEIATLRALGFGPLPVVASVLAEALALALLGGLIGACTAYLLLDGRIASTMGASFSQVSFDYAITSALALRGVTWAAALGLIGGLIPALAAARKPVTAALRQH